MAELIHADLFQEPKKSLRKSSNNPNADRHGDLRLRRFIDAIHAGNIMVCQDIIDKWGDDHALQSRLNTVSSLMVKESHEAIANDDPMNLSEEMEEFLLDWLVSS
jgi:hypothetical protein